MHQHVGDRDADCHHECDADEPPVEPSVDRRFSRLRDVRAVVVRRLLGLLLVIGDEGLRSHLWLRTDVLADYPFSDTSRRTAHHTLFSFA